MVPSPWRGLTSTPQEASTARFPVTARPSTHFFPEAYEEVAASLIADGTKVVFAGSRLAYDGLPVPIARTSSSPVSSATEQLTVRSPVTGRVDRFRRRERLGFRCRERPLPRPLGESSWRGRPVPVPMTPVRTSRWRVIRRLGFPTPHSRGTAGRCTTSAASIPLPPCFSSPAGSTSRLARRTPRPPQTTDTCSQSGSARERPAPVPRTVATAPRRPTATATRSPTPPTTAPTRPIRTRGHRRRQDRRRL